MDKYLGCTQGLRDKVKKPDIYMQNDNINTESFTVKFMLLQPDGYWKYCEELFKGKSKSSHYDVELCCMKKYGKQNIQIKSIIYH